MVPHPSTGPKFWMNLKQSSRVSQVQHHLNSPGFTLSPNYAQNISICHDLVQQGKRFKTSQHSQLILKSQQVSGFSAGAEIVLQCLSLYLGPLLCKLYLSRVDGEYKHDGKPCEQPCILDGESYQRSTSSGFLFFTTHLIHLRKLQRGTKEYTWIVRKMIKSTASTVSIVNKFLILLHSFDQKYS